MKTKVGWAIRDGVGRVFISYVGDRGIIQTFYKSICSRRMDCISIGGISIGYYDFMASLLFSQKFDVEKLSHYLFFFVSMRIYFFLGEIENLLFFLVIVLHKTFLNSPKFTECILTFLTSDFHVFSPRLSVFWFPLSYLLLFAIWNADCYLKRISV